MVGEWWSLTKHFWCFKRLKYGNGRVIVRVFTLFLSVWHWDVQFYCTTRLPETQFKLQTDLHPMAGQLIQEHPNGFKNLERKVGEMVFAIMAGPSAAAHSALPLSLRTRNGDSWSTTFTENDFAWRISPMVGTVTDSDVKVRQFRPPTKDETTQEEPTTPYTMKIENVIIGSDHLSRSFRSEIKTNKLSPVPTENNWRRPLFHGSGFAHAILI